MAPNPSTVQPRATPVSNENQTAFPGLHLINRGVGGLKGAMQDGQRGITVKKTGAYLGYRLISYSCIPLLANAISLIVSGIFFLLSLPTRLCCKGDLNRYFEARLRGSWHYLGESVRDLAYDACLLINCCSCKGK